MYYNIIDEVMQAKQNSLNYTERSFVCINIIYVMDGVHMKSFCFCLTFLVQLNPVISGKVEAIKTNLVFAVNQTAQLQWRVTPENGERIHSVQMYVLGPPVVMIMYGFRTAAEPVQAGKTMFGERLSGSFSNSTYTLFIKKIQFNENMSFKFDVAFLVQSSGRIENAIVVIKNVVGGPDVCGNSLNSSYIVNEGKQLSFMSEVCGNPKPVLTWKLHNELEYSYSTEVAPVNISSMRYRYVYKTRRLVTREDCGTKLVFNATGANGTIKGHAILDVSFRPRKLRKVIFYKDNNCINGTWTSEATGNCALNYHLQFVERSDIFNTTDTHYAVCNIFNISSVVIWASYKNNYGKKAIVNISLTTPAPSTKAVDACKHPISFEVKMLDTKKLFVTIIITLVVTQIANICIYGVIKLRGAETNWRNKESTKKDDGIKDTQDYEVFSTAEAHYTGLQLEARKETAYADLSPTTVNEYSEIGTEISQNKCRPLEEHSHSD